MTTIVSYKTVCFGILFSFLLTSLSDAQTKRIKRPKGSVGIRSIDNFVTESFDLYDKVYKYDGYAASGTPLEDEDIDVLEEASDDVLGLTESAPSIISDLDGENMLTQAKATLRINRAKKALKYSIKTSKKLLLGEDSDEDDEDEVDDDSDDESEDEMDDDEADYENSPSDQTSQEPEKTPSNISDNLEILSKYDFVPGNKTLFYDDFSKEYGGDFPSRWNTNASGEIVNINNEKWFELRSGSSAYFIPDLKVLPEDYTIEFDLLTNGLDSKTSSLARLFIILSDSDTFSNGEKHYAYCSIPLGQYDNFAITLYNHFNNSKGKINSKIAVDLRKEVLNQPHVAISVTKQRFRMWINEVKYVDIPRFIEESNVFNFLKLKPKNLKEGKEQIFIKNFKIAEGGQDLRRQLIADGKISTNGILFDSGSATIKKQSYGIIKQISQVLMQDENIKLKIVGHTDADGNDSSNLNLSKSRAEAVKEILIDLYKIDKTRLTFDGKGETEPVGDNKTTTGKAENRRVEFILQ